ncbi:unnamed protein product [Darwinula stevensoni]|uniref:Uncharacterized protein n=1 Tax=Darwinula stevensoni TaxID=69355 RepID=A0A7R8XKM7_9CRUS|nr:unnamed protein product [Darwinula stevensoni]CAG0895910.1 unnamed protein product [Darwinula stevensoni]
MISDEIDTFGTYGEVYAAFLDGKNIQAEVDVAGAKVVAWVREESGDAPGIHFSQSIVNIDGDVVIQEFHLRDNNILYITGTTFNPVDPDDVPDIITFTCTLGDAAIFSAPAYDLVELLDYASVLEAQLSGEKLSAGMDFSQCLDAKNKVDLTDAKAGAYFEHVTVLLHDSPWARLSGSAFGVHSDPVSGVAYATFGVTLDADNNVDVFPGYWRIDENGDWMDDFSGIMFECTLGAGIMFFVEV